MIALVDGGETIIHQHKTNDDEYEKKPKNLYFDLKQLK